MAFLPRVQSLRPGPILAGWRENVGLQQVQSRLSPAAQRELARSLDDLLDFLEQNDEPDREERVVVTLVSSPLVRT